MTAHDIEPLQEQPAAQPDCVTVYNMFFKTMGIRCDTCDTETLCEGREATLAAVTAQARHEGWAISSAGHYCPQHRGRARR